jgi:hypothetical protein
MYIRYPVSALYLLNPAMLVPYITTVILRGVHTLVYIRNIYE